MGSWSNNNTVNLLLSRREEVEWAWAYCTVSPWLLPYYVFLLSASHHYNFYIEGTVSRDGFGFWWQWLVLGLNRGRGHFKKCSRPLFSLELTIHQIYTYIPCHQKPNPSREAVPLINGFILGTLLSCWALFSLIRVPRERGLCEAGLPASKSADQATHLLQGRQTCMRR